MLNSNAPVGNSEERHVTEIEEGDLVWSPDLLRWRRITSVFQYTTELSGVPMIKLVMDLSVFVRHTLSAETKYHVLLDAEPPARVAPHTAAGRHRQRAKSTETETETDAPAATSANVVEPAATQNAPEMAQPTAADRVQPAGDVRARRDALRISRGKFAELCGLSAGALWRVEDGRPKDDELERVLRALDEREATGR